MQEDGPDIDVLRKTGAVGPDGYLLRFLISGVVFVLYCWAASRFATGATLLTAVLLGALVIYCIGTIVTSQPGFRAAAFLRETPAIIALLVGGADLALRQMSQLGIRAHTPSWIVASIALGATVAMLPAVRRRLEANAQTAFEKSLKRRDRWEA